MISCVASDSALSSAQKTRRNVAIVKAKETKPIIVEPKLMGSMVPTLLMLPMART